jgi:hypothetical protein
MGANRKCATHSKILTTYQKNKTNEKLYYLVPELSVDTGVGRNSSHLLHGFFSGKLYVADI